MKTCPQCGCYVPDKWITCPSCDARVKISKEALSTYPSKASSDNVYQVKIYYKDGTVTNNIFGIRENAINNAKNTMDRFGHCIKKVEIFDCKKIAVSYPNT
jgi:hypothetical protein